MPGLENTEGEVEVQTHNHAQIASQLSNYALGHYLAAAVHPVWFCRGVSLWSTPSTGRANQHSIVHSLWYLWVNNLCESLHRYPRILWPWLSWLFWIPWISLSWESRHASIPWIRIWMGGHNNKPRFHPQSPHVKESFQGLHYTGLTGLNLCSLGLPSCQGSAFWVPISHIL